MLTNSTYKTVDELPDLLKGKKESYNNVDELPDLKKKEIPTSRVFGGLSHPFINTGSKSTGSPTDFKGRNEKGNLVSDTKGIKTWQKAPEVSKKPPEEKVQPKSVFDIPESVNYNTSLLDEQELKEYNQQTAGVQYKQHTDVIKDIISQRNNPDVMRKRADEFIQEDLKGEGASALHVTDEHGLDIPQYFKKRKDDIRTKIQEVQDEIDKEGFVKDVPDQKKVMELNRLRNKLDDINKYANVLNKEYAIKSTNPSQYENKSDYLKAVGRNINKVNEYERVSKKEQDIYSGAEKNKVPDIVQKEDFNDELTGINALQNKTIEDAMTGNISVEQAKADLSELRKENVDLENKYPKVKMDNLRNWLGNYISENRKKDGTLAKGWHNIVYAEPTKQEVNDGIRTAIANSNGDLKVSEEEINQLIKDKDKIPLTSLVGHAYKTFILEPSQALDKWVSDEHDGAKERYERNLAFQDPAVLQSVQPEEISTEMKIAPGVTAIRNAPNPNAGKQADFFSTATLNNIGDVAGIIGSYALGNKAFGGLGMENIGANITTSAFLNYHHNLERAKEITDNTTEQHLVASAKSIITGLVFAGINPNKLLGKVVSEGEDAGMRKLLDAFKKDGIASTDPLKFKNLITNTIVNTANDLGKNIALMDADKMADYAIDAIVNKASVENRDLGQELLHELPSQVASLGIFSALHGYKKTKAQSIDRAKAIETMEMAAENVPAFEAGLKKRIEEGTMTKEDADVNLKFARSLQEKLIGNDLKTGRTENFSKEQKIAYAINLVKEQELKEKVKELSDKVQIDEHNRDIKELADERKSILDNKHDEYIQTAELHERVLSKGTHDQTLNEGTKTQGVQFLQEQALSAPAPTKRSLKGDETITTDLIARNKPEEIKAEIKELKEKHKKLIEGENKAEANEVQKNIDLLEAGLEKQKPIKQRAEEGGIVIEEPIKTGEVIPLKEEPLSESGIVVEPPMQKVEAIEIKPEPKNEEAKVEVHQPPEVKEPPKEEPNKIEPTAEPPKETIIEVVEEGEPKKGITHAAVAELRKLVDLPEYEGKPVETHEQLIAEAQQKIKDNPNAANDVMERMEKGGKITNKDNAVMAIYKATLDAEIEKNPTKELLNRARKVAVILDVAGTEHGKLLESRKLIAKEDNLANFLLDKEAAQGTALSEKQITDEAAKYNELKEAKEKLEIQLEQEREQHKKDIVELGLNKAKAKAKKDAKKSDEDYKAERKIIVEDARAALKKIREQGLHSTIPGALELKAITPFVKKYLNSLGSHAIDKLDIAIAEIHAEFKDILEGLTKRNVLDILAGEHDEVKDKTKNEKNNAIRLLKREASLLKELESARKGAGAVKKETEKTESNRRIDELKEKIKEVQQLNKKNIEVEPVQDLSAGSLEDVAKYEQKLKNRIDKLNKDLKEGNYLKEPEKKPIFKKTRKAQILEDRVIDLENKIRHERSKDEYNKRKWYVKWFDRAMQVLGIRRLVQSAVDISVPFRQGATMLSPRKIDVWAKGFSANIKSVFSPKKFERIMHEIRNDPQYHEMSKDGVVFNDLGSADPNLHNEDFRKSFVYKIPVISEPLKASNRSADAFLNVTRLELYKKMRNNLEKRGLTRESDPEAFKYVANWAMSMTGRGNMTKMFENPKARTVLGNTFYGARLMASRFNLLNPVTYFDPRIPKEAKYEAMKDMAAFVTTTMAIGTALSYTTGAKISLNPDDSDFLQLRYTNKVYDISGGLANYVRTGLRIIKAGYTKRTGTKYQANEATDNAGKSILNFFRNKLSPNTAYAADAFFGGRYGQDFDPSDIYRIYPMYAEDFLKAIKEEGGLLATSTVLLPNILGIGYGSYASKGQIDANLEDLLKRNMRSDEMDSEKIHNYNDGGRAITFKEFNDFADKRDKKIEDDLTKLFKEGIGDTPYKDLTEEQVQDETSYIKANATRETKEEMFGKPKPTRQEKRASKELSKERKEKYKSN